VAYSPVSPLTQRIVGNVREKANFVGFYNAASLNKAIDNNENFSLAIQFSDGLLGAQSNNNLPPEVEITLR
jgi:hypothetical protein